MLTPFDWLRRCRTGVELVLTTSPEKTALHRITRLLQKPGAKAGCVVVVPTDEMDVTQVKDRFLAQPGPLIGRFTCNTTRALLGLADTLIAYQSQGTDDTRPGELLEEMWAELPDACCPAPWAVLELKDLRLELELKLTHRHQKALSRMLSSLPCRQCNHESLCHGKHHGSRRLRLLMEELYEMKSRPDEHPGLLHQLCCFHREYLRNLGLTGATSTGRMALGLGIKSPEILAVCVERGVVPLGDPSLSIAMVGGFADCAPGQGPRLVRKFLTRDLEQGMARLAEFLSTLQEQILRWGRVVKKPITAQSATVMAWNQGEELEYIAAETGMTPDALTSLIEQSTLLVERLRALYRQEYNT